MTSFTRRRPPLTTAVIDVAALLDPDPALVRPVSLVVPAGIPLPRAKSLVTLAQRLYTVWDTGDFTLLSVADRGAAGAVKSVRQAVPDLRCSLLALAIEDDGFSAQLRFTGHFSGTRGAVRGRGQWLDTTAYDAQLWPPARAA